MGQISLQIPQTGQLFSTEGPKVASDMTTIQTVINGNLDTTNLSASAAITRSQFAGGGGNLTETVVTGNTSATDGHLYQVNAGSVTITLPAAAANATIGVYAGSGQTGATPVTVTASSGAIFGPGTSTASVSLGTVGAFVVLQGNGSNWLTVAGQQDTGWVALTLGTNIGAAIGTYTPAARIVGSRVELSGTLKNNTGGTLTSTAVLATLPVGYAPASTVWLTTNDSTGTAEAMNITGASLSLVLQGAAGLLNTHFLFLDGLWYRLV